MKFNFVRVCIIMFYAERVYFFINNYFACWKKVFSRSVVQCFRSSAHLFVMYAKRYWLSFIIRQFELFSAPLRLFLLIVPSIAHVDQSVSFHLMSKPVDLSFICSFLIVSSFLNSLLFFSPPHFPTSKSLLLSYFDSKMFHHRFIHCPKRPRFCYVHCHTSHLTAKYY